MDSTKSLGLGKRLLKPMKYETCQTLTNFKFGIISNLILLHVGHVHDKDMSESELRIRQRSRDQGDYRVSGGFML